MADPVGSTVGKILRDFKYELTVGLVSAELMSALGDYLGTGRIEFDLVPEELANLITPIISEAERTIGQPLFEFLVTAPTGVNLSRSPDAQENIAVSMIQRMIGFAIALPYGIAKLKTVLEATMGENAAKGLVEALEKIPEEIGVNWALGSMLDRIMETAAARPIEEAIAAQTRPQRFEWPQIRALARMHSVPESDLRERLAASGWRDKDIELLLQVDRQRLSLGDVQQVYLHGLRDQSWVKDYLVQLGLDGEDNDLAMQLYIERAETAGGDQLRAVAQRAYLDDNITKAEYAAILRKVNVPQQSIDLELQAADLAKQQGHKQLSVGEIKLEVLENIIDDAQARQKLEKFGYNDTDANDLIKAWHTSKTASRPGLSVQKVLAYLVSGVLSPADAYDRLLGLGVRDVDATFLVQHPTAAGPVKSHGPPLTTITSAYKDGIIDLPTAERLLVEHGLSADAASLEVQVAAYVKPRGEKPKKPPRMLSESHIIAAFKRGLATSAWAARELITLGYSETDANIIIAIEETPAPTAKNPSGGPLPLGWVVLT